MEVGSWKLAVAVAIAVVAPAAISLMVVSVVLCSQAAAMCVNPSSPRSLLSKLMEFKALFYNQVIESNDKKWNRIEY